MVLRNETSGAVVAESVRLARDPITRGIGLLLNKTVGPNEGLWIGGCNAVHTMMMRATIDLYFLDSDKRVLKIEHAVAPGQLAVGCRGAKSVVELGAAPQARAVAVGDRLVLE
jgi:uncharacterized membrane protein (UPF0127 family)